jgi:hypothetical protein
MHEQEIAAPKALTPKSWRDATDGSTVYDTSSGTGCVMHHSKIDPSMSGVGQKQT